MPKVVQSFPLQQQKGRKAISNQLNGWQFPIKNIIDVAGVAPVLSSIGQSEFTQGSNISGVVITGTGFTGATSISLGAGITINSFDVTDDNNINIIDADVDQNALIGNRDVSVTTPSGTGTLLNGCQVIFGFGNALKFDGVNDFVSFPTISKTTSFTISGWFKLDDNGGYSYLLSSSVTNHGFAAASGGTFIGGDSKAIYYYPGSGALQKIASYPSFGQWFHLAFTYSGTILSVYVNGVFSNSQAISITGDFNQIGRLYTGANFLNGLADECGIDMTQAATAQNITDLYNGGSGADFVGVMGSADLYYKFNESGTAITAVDSSGNGNNGTLNNFSGTYWVPH